MIRFPDQLDASVACPGCGGSGLRRFYDVPNIPTQSNLLMATRQEALEYPRGDLRLAFCPRCGFITNTAFDPATQEHSTRYEATQGHSPTFSAFAKTLAQRWADRYALKGKRILEIGCLNGEFIALLCMTADATGVGIDPVLSALRTPDTGDRVRYIADLYSEKYANLPADFICCRHTLEHINTPFDFLAMIRRTIGARRDVVVCFEVPDVLRVLQEGAFWDLYYEHCSYFSQASLSGLFSACGFEVMDERREFDDQYLVIDARPSTFVTPSLANADITSGFESACAAQLDKWRPIVGSGRRIAIWGSGSKAVGFLTTLRVSHEAIPFVVDINPHKHGTFLPGTGQEIIAPRKLIEYQPEVIIAMNPVYRTEIQVDLDKMKVKAELITLA